MTHPQPDPVEAKPTLGVPAGIDTVPPAGSASGRLRLEPGASPLPDYQLVQFLGRGGFGEVWKALGPGGFAVALKFILLSDHAGAGEERSAELLKAKEVRHPNLLGLFGSWRRDDLFIVAMELADRTLLDRLKEANQQGQPGVPLPELLEYMREAAKGLDHLHAIGVHHRDVKPQNLLLVGGGVKVADFGLAKLLEQTSISSSGAMTPAYAAPEFLKGRVSPHSDQYALAVTYCQLRGGRLPFEGGAAQVLTGHLCEPPDLTMLPDAEKSVVGRALAKEPHDRWPSCRDFVQALVGSSSGIPHGDMPTVTLPAHRPGRRTFAMIMAGVLCLLAAIFVWIWVNWTPSLPVGPAEKPFVTDDNTTIPPDVGETQAKNTPPAKAEPSKEVVTAIAMRLTLIPAGKFQMGSADDEKGRYDNEGPRHEVAISHPFYLGVHPVTKHQFADFVNAEHYQTEAEKDGKGGQGYDAAARTFDGPNSKYSWTGTGFAQGDDHPVVNVSWNDAVNFCGWLSKKEGKLYELPTEAEWEYACRAGTSTRFWCGEDDASLNGADNVRDASLKEKLDAGSFKDWTFPIWNDGYPFTSPVGKFRANAWGLYDMHGNVWQWCADRHEKYPEGPATDPTGPAEGDFRILRGGSWHSVPALCRSAARHAFDPADRGADVGFRVVLRILRP